MTPTATIPATADPATPAGPGRPGFFARHPWLFVIFAFLLLIGAWSTLIVIAVKHSPQRVELPAKSGAGTETGGH